MPLKIGEENIAACDIDLFEIAVHNGFGYTSPKVEAGDAVVIAAIDLIK